LTEKIAKSRDVEILQLSHPAINLVIYNRNGLTKICPFCKRIAEELFFFQVISQVKGLCLSLEK